MPSLPGASTVADRATDEGASPDGPSEGDACQNGPMPQLPSLPSALSPTKSPAGPAAPPGVAGFHDNLRKSQGTSAEGSVRKEALQSLRRSLPMQETQLCKHPTPPPLPSLPSHGQGPSVCHSGPCVYRVAPFQRENTHLRGLIFVVVFQVQI